jgi:hypothetical protein
MKVFALITVIFCMSNSLLAMEASRQTFAQEWKMVDKGKRILDNLRQWSSDSESDEGYGKRKVVSQREIQENKALDFFNRAKEIALQRNADDEKVRNGNGLMFLCSEIEKQKKRI